MENQKIIDISKYISDNITSLVGRHNGEKLASKLIDNKIILDQIEKDFDSIVFVIPKKINILNKSYFLGWLETRVQSLGKDVFIHKYHFDADQYIIDQIHGRYIDAALMTLSAAKILNVEKK
jgi:hypothetical protein